MAHRLVLLEVGKSHVHIVGSVVSGQCTLCSGRAYVENTGSEGSANWFGQRRP